MAVPKKKISYSKTRQRFLSKKNNLLKLYSKCTQCLSFIKLHHFCPSCNNKGVYSQKVKNNFNTNIHKLYENNL